jgi:hypothetical protein
VLEDGTYEVFIVDVEEVNGDERGALRLSLTVTSGPCKGEVVDIRGNANGRDVVDLIGMPATLVVTNGTPRLSLDD